MKNLEQTIREWLSPGLPADGQLALAAYGNDIALAQIGGNGFRLPVGNPWSDYHVLLQLYEGELQLTLDGEKGVFLIDTPKTAAVVSVDAVNGSAGVLNVNIHKGFALVSASAMDGKILKESGKILLFHLTNVQNFNQRFSDSTLALMETWGAPQHVVRRGVADVELTLTPGETPRVYGVDLFGERIGEVPSKFNSSTGKLLFTADTFALKHPCMVYEIVR